MSKESSANDEGIFEPFDLADVPSAESRNGRFGIRYQLVGDYGGAVDIGVNIEVLDPGCQAHPFHYHKLEEEHLMVLDGALTLRLGERTYEMKAGHYVCFPAGQKAGHALLNQSDTPCRYLIIGGREPNEVVVYPDSGRVGVRLMGEGYRKSAVMDYWEGEKTEN